MFSSQLSAQYVFIRTLVLQAFVFKIIVIVSTNKRSVSILSVSIQRVQACNIEAISHSKAQSSRNIRYCLSTSTKQKRQIECLFSHVILTRQLT